jgi:DDE superfamily endonuclease
MVLTEDSFVELGLSLHNFRYSIAQQQRETQFTKFRRLYGIDPKSCLDAFKAIQTRNTPERIDPKKACPYDFLLTLEWLRKYKDELDLAGLYGLSESTVSKVVWRYTRAIQGLKSRKIVWMEQWSNANSEIVIVSVDGVHCKIREPRRTPSSKWYSHKTHGPALGYEIAVAIHHNKVVHINGPFPAGVPDISIFRKDGGLKSKIPDGKVGTADRGYMGEPKLRPPNPQDTPLAKEFKKRAQARHETFNARLKSFKILSERFRHRHTPHGKHAVTCHDNHQSAFEAVCVLLQFDMDNGHPLFMI